MEVPEQEHSSVEWPTGFVALGAVGVDNDNVVMGESASTAAASILVHSNIRSSFQIR